MHLGVSGRTFTVPEPGGAVGVALQLAERLPAYVEQATLFGHSSLSDQFGTYELASTGMVSRTLPYGVVWEQALVPTLGRQRDIDVLFCPNALCPLRSTDFPVVIMIHDIPEFHGYGSGPYVRFRKALLPKVVQRADHIVTVSEFTRRDLERHLGVPSDDVSVVYNGIDSIYLDEKLPDVTLDFPDPYLLFVGAMSERKNVAGIVEAFTRFKREHGTDHSLVLVGPEANATYDVLDPASLAPAVEGEIHRPGYLTKAELKAAYMGADAFVFPSQHESFGLPPLEAAACGTPVVTSRAGAIPEVLGESARFVDPDDVVDIAEGIAWAVFDSEADGVAAQAKTRAGEFTWERATKELTEILDSVSAP